MTDLGRLPGTTCSRANQINDEGQIVGNASDCVTLLAPFCGRTAGPWLT